MNAFRMMTMTLLCGLVVWIGSSSSVLAQVYRGVAFSADDFKRVQLSIKNKLRGYEKAGFAYCVCKNDRSKIVYVYAFSGSAQNSLAASCQKAAADCGGCFKTPLFTWLRSSAYKAAQEDDQRRRQFLQLFGGEGDMGGAPRKVLPAPN
jgi:hypothetical protein